MTNDEVPKYPKKPECRNPNGEPASLEVIGACRIRHSGFVILSGLGISSFVIATMNRAFSFLAFLLCLASPLAADVALTPETSLRIVERVPAEELKGQLAPFLQKYLLAALRRAELEGAGEVVTFTLEARHALWHEVPPQELKDVQDIDAFEVEVGENAVRISGPTMLAAGYGTGYFLEKHLGVTWVMPGELGVVLPARTSFRLKPGRERVKPAFVSRTYTGMLYPDPAYRLAFQKSDAGRILQPERHYFTAHDYFKSLRLHLLTHASHNMFNIYPVEKYGATLPEIYPIKNGKRFIPPDRNAWHPCYANPKTLEIALARMAEAFEKQKTHCFSLGINDGLRVQCQCPDCTRSPWPTPYFDYVKKVAEQAKRYYPPHLIGVLAYGDVKFPLPDLVLPENVLVLVTGSRLAAWQGHARHLGTYEYAYGSGFWVPNFPLKAMKVNALAYRQFGAKVYHAEVHPVWAFDAPKVFIQSRLLWDPDLDVEAALKTFCDAAFGAGG
ncbi:MAG: DUF4838 domain-containing protein, partial [Planctomycetes bacterium]|nr:DUF4838 domain-containing protein [Planctomycetota bacterium]